MSQINAVGSLFQRGGTHSSMLDPITYTRAV